VIEMLHDADPEVRATALGILGEMDAQAAVPISDLVRCLRDRDADVRKAAAVALGQTGDRRAAVAAVLPLLIALRDREGEVSDAARDALARIGRPVLPAVLSRWNAVTAHAIEPVEEFESVVIPLDAPGR
jgi:HEAT repeat protein